MRGDNDGHQSQRMERIDGEQKTSILNVWRLQTVEMSSLRSSNFTENCVYD